MKNISNIFKITLAVLTAIIGAGFFYAPSALAAGELTVKTWDGAAFVSFNSIPLFNFSNFAPGNSTSGSVSIFNASSSQKKIVVWAANASNPENDKHVKLGDALTISIAREGETSPFYSGKLTDFLRAEYVVLDDLSGGGSEIYDFTVSFDPLAGNDYQAAGASFDLNIGSWQEKRNDSPSGHTYLSMGGSATLGLTIPNESVASATNGEDIVIKWTTSYPATSWVIYSAEGEDPHTLDINEPLHYGYAHSTVENTYKTQTHSVTISGLVPGTIYHYRCVSRGSLAVSLDYTFTTAKREEIIQNFSGQNENLGLSDVNQGGSVQGSGPLAVNSFTPQASGTSTEIENSNESGQTGQSNQNNQGQPSRQNGQDQTNNEKISNNPFSPNNLGASISNFLNFQNAKDFWLAWFLIAFLFAMFFAWSRKKRKGSSRKNNSPKIPPKI